MIPLIILVGAIGLFAKIRSDRKHKAQLLALRERIYALADDSHSTTWLLKDFPTTRTDEAIERSDTLSGELYKIAKELDLAYDRVGQ